jgi:hypothetical protein
VKVEKIKSVNPDFQEGVGPSEVITLGLNVDGTFIGLGRYYSGPHSVEAHIEIFDKMEKFADECVKRFSDKKTDCSGKCGKKPTEGMEIPEAEISAEDAKVVKELKRRGGPHWSL